MHKILKYPEMLLFTVFNI